MKLLYCPNCGDVFNLKLVEKQCSCGKTKGIYLSDCVQARYTGGIPLGFNNNLFRYAITSQPEYDMGKDFPAFVIPKNCNTFKEIKKDS